MMTIDNVKVILWIISTIILNLQMKKTITKYGSKTHNRFKPLLSMILLLPILQLSNIDFHINLFFLVAVMLSITVTHSVIFNKMIETVPMYLMNMVIILTSLETFLIDIFSGKAELTYLLALSLLLKIIGIYIIISKGHKDKNNEQTKVNFKAYLIIFILSIMTIVRMYVTDKAIKDYNATSSMLAFAMQLAIFLFANIAYRKEKLQLSRQLIKDYIPQTFITVLSDILY